jgi:hypothetical protein
MRAEKVNQIGEEGTMIMTVVLLRRLEVHIVEAATIDLVTMIETRRGQEITLASLPRDAIMMHLLVIEDRLFQMISHQERREEVATAVARYNSVEDTTMMVQEGKALVKEVQ